MINNLMKTRELAIYPNRIQEERIDDPRSISEILGINITFSYNLIFD